MVLFKYYFYLTSGIKILAPFGFGFCLVIIFLKQSISIPIKYRFSHKVFFSPIKYHSLEPIVTKAQQFGLGEIIEIVNFDKNFIVD